MKCSSLIEDLGVNNGDMLPTPNTMAPKSPPFNTRENIFNRKGEETKLLRIMQ